MFVILAAIALFALLGFAPAITAKELREKRGAIIKEIRGLAEKLKVEDYSFTAEERTKFDSLEADAKKMESRIADLERADELEFEMRAPANQPGSHRGAIPGAGDIDGRQDPLAGGSQTRSDEHPAISHEDRAIGLQAWMRRATGRRLDDRQQQALTRCLVRSSDSPMYEDDDSVDGRVLCMRLARTAEHRQMVRESRALTDTPQTLTTTAGGYTVAQGFVPQLERAMLAFGNVQSVCDVIRTSGGNPLPWPSVNDTSNAGEMIDLNSTISNAALSFGSVTFNAFKGSSKLILVPTELLQDSAFNLESFIADAIGERLGRLVNAQCTTGVGTTAPKGMVVAATSGLTTASATAITADELLTLMHSVDPAYRDPAFNCGWMFNDTVLLALKQIKDGQGRYLFPELRLPAPRHEGFPVSINQQMPAATAGLKPVLFGAFRKHKIRMVAEIRLKRLVERWGEFDQEGFVGFVRFDSNIVDAGTHPIKCITMHA